MNIRSLTRGDGVVIGAAVVLFIASFLNTSDCSGSACDLVPNAWGLAYFLGWGTFFLGIVGAALIVVSHLLPQSQPRKVAGLDLAQAGVVLTVATAWQLLMWIFESQAAGSGLILGLIAALILAAGAVAGPLVPALQAPLMPAPKPAAPQPFGAQPQAGYGYPGAPGGPQQGGGYGYPGAQAPQAQQSPQPQPAYGGGQPQPQPQQDGGQAPSGDFTPYWFAVPVARPLYAEDGSMAPIAELAPGTWYLAVEQRGQALVAQTQDGRRGVLQDTTGIQRG
ncbi:hypothetical protein [Streptomyces sp. NPDC059828]|uniref:hypothetical protein n=1 Tax=Streptomyces sp. NPDC059828 TaxID=3346965 RepID=UPI0036699A6C